MQLSHALLQQGQGQAQVKTCSRGGTSQDPRALLQDSTAMVSSQAVSPSAGGHSHAPYNAHGEGRPLP